MGGGPEGVDTGLRSASELLDKSRNRVDPALELGSGWSKLVRVMVAGIGQRAPREHDLPRELGITQVLGQTQELRSAIRSLQSGRPFRPQIIECLFKRLAREQSGGSGPETSGACGRSADKISGGVDQRGR